ncbi:Concanavalin A-like lectin/glucanases superfamily protein [Micromonospora pattaloongensis]|uniref:Concanavalin A-like lectin/glucanases superfamily protein n=1 Tax=Micromonospora pattaloongensis TaxID=405436 RepID=A0A1H3QSI3_9ACTN|nr:LamG-like jellyroll fold domain-containing protein [Micromonospora pattaloongensis]SDZ16233.1 Concanavalin A-like lectin/glucanases superfamily protein [Micromonospora pattaloongensis]
MTRTGPAAVATAALVALGALTGAGAPPAQAAPTGPRDVHPQLRPHLVAYYDFDHPVPGDPALERDRGRSGTEIELTNGGAAMRVPDRAYRGAGHALRTGQVNPAQTGNDDWKAGIYSAGGVRTLRPFSGVAGTTVMGWFKLEMDAPALNSSTADPADRFNAIGLAGVLTGDSDGHGVRALLELIDVNGELRLVALGRRLDGGNSQTFAASRDWRTLLPKGEWVHLAATFDFGTGAMALYRNGRPVDGFYTRTDDPWLVSGPGPHVTTASDPRGIKIGGSFPQNTLERNPCDCRMDALMFLDTALSARQVQNQYRYQTR